MVALLGHDCRPNLGGGSLVVSVLYFHMRTTLAPFVAALTALACSTPVRFIAAGLLPGDMASPPRDLTYA